MADKLPMRLYRCTNSAGGGMWVIAPTVARATLYFVQMGRARAQKNVKVDDQTDFFLNEKDHPGTSVSLRKLLDEVHAPCFAYLEIPNTVIDFATMKVEEKGKRQWLRSM